MAKTTFTRDEVIALIRDQVEQRKDLKGGQARLCSAIGIRDSHLIQFIGGKTKGIPTAILNYLHLEPCWRVKKGGAE
jgi:hypothetical protein